MTLDWPLHPSLAGAAKPGKDGSVCFPGSSCENIRNAGFLSFSKLGSGLPKVCLILMAQSSDSGARRFLRTESPVISLSGSLIKPASPLGIVGPTGQWHPWEWCLEDLLPGLHSRGVGLLLMTPSPT